MANSRPKVLPLSPSEVTFDYSSPLSHRTAETSPMVRSRPVVERLTWQDYFNHLQFTRAYVIFYSIMAALGIFLVMSTFYVSFPHPLWFVTLEGAVTISFSLEILMQMVAQGGKFFGTWWGYVEFIMLVMCIFGYMEELAVRHPSILAFTRKYHLGEYPMYDLLDECIIFLRYGAQAGRVFVFMREKPMNDNLILTNVDIDAVNDYLQPKSSEGEFDNKMYEDALHHSFNIPSEVSYDSFGSHRRAESHASNV